MVYTASHQEPDNAQEDGHLHGLVLKNSMIRVRKKPATVAAAKNIAVATPPHRY